MKIVLSLLALAMVASPSLTKACSIVAPPPSETANRIATQGMLIKGRLIQAFDPDKERPEIIEVEEMYVGKVQHRRIVIYRSKAVFDMVRRHRDAKMAGIPKTGCGSLACCRFGGHRDKLN